MRAALFSWALIYSGGCFSWSAAISLQCVTDCIPLCGSFVLNNVTWLLSHWKMALRRGLEHWEADLICQPPRLHWLLHETSLVDGTSFFPKTHISPLYSQSLSMEKILWWMSCTAGNDFAFCSDNQSQCSCRRMLQIQSGTMQVGTASTLCIPMRHCPATPVLYVYPWGSAQSFMSIHEALPRNTSPLCISMRQCPATPARCCPVSWSLIAWLSSGPLALVSINPGSTRTSSQLQVSPISCFPWTCNQSNR